ncbi:MAG TPA: NAD(P)-dependent oxidoreductase [Candidatus Limnocylindria bacterium]|nr:NAD(P)-dependent oxidoreductase [Candidatus Limnocylindria bacterium]
MPTRIAFIGLGVMGYPMAGHLARAGHVVTVHNRSPAKSERWAAEYGGAVAESPEAAAREAEVVLACVGNDDDVRSVTIGTRGAFGAMAPGAVFVDHTTASPTLARALAAEAELRGCRFLDAPVSGGQVGAEQRRLTVMAGGDAEALERVRPLVACYAHAVRHMGPSGTGQLTKLVNQICIAGLVQGLAEGVAFARAAGLDVAAVVEVLSKGAAQSWQMDHRATTMAAGRFDFGFAVDWMRKDLAIALAEARDRGFELPVARLVDGFYAEVQQMGGGRWDTSSLIARLVPGAPRSSS